LEIEIARRLQRGAIGGAKTAVVIAVDGRRRRRAPPPTIARATGALPGNDFSLLSGTRQGREDLEPFESKHNGDIFRSGPDSGVEDRETTFFLLLRFQFRRRPRWAG
jgi:hypothetical protein